jgi:phosphohistidine phosphatase
MFELLLLRHAKSSWAESGQDDVDRPLNARGREAAKLMGRTIATQGMLPGRVLCSPAARTRETWEIARKELPAQPPLVIVDALYDFGDGDAVLEAIKLHGGTFSRLLVVAHNPAIQNLALRLTGTGSAKLRRRLAEKYPTAALAVLGFDVSDWSALGQHQGKLLSFIRPRDLPA